MSEMRPCGSQAISDLVVFARKDGHPYNDLVYTFLLPCAGVAAEELQLPLVLMWNQPSTVPVIFY
ncbi:UDP-glucuronosyl/UDP-glucosyltransferase [Parasponia andersonii]|uniref:UDP-glucuronosyl/UDP-glucosyltransferase n=1 Tax=Parasponia andersonii TaxID=3476 RepID=A0A2P5C3V6_PARAD|nr:UDP-glucuronosyl/UDP-glucosyltransferase [Parasponia andersonii]